MLPKLTENKQEIIAKSLETAGHALLLLPEAKSLPEVPGSAELKAAMKRRDLKADVLAKTPVAVQLPGGSGPAHTSSPFRGVIDLVDMHWIEFDPASDGKNVTITEIPEQFLDDALLWREQMMEVVYELSEEAMALALEEQPVPRELIIAALRKGTLSRQIQPVFCGSALHGMGVQPLLSGVNDYLPSPLDRPPVEGVDPKNHEKTLQRSPSNDEPFCALAAELLFPLDDAVAIPVKFLFALFILDITGPSLVPSFWAICPQPMPWLRMVRTPGRSVVVVVAVTPLPVV